MHRFSEAALEKTFEVKNTFMTSYEGFNSEHLVQNPYSRVAATE